MFISVCYVIASFFFSKTFLYIMLQNNYSYYIITKLKDDLYFVVRPTLGLDNQVQDLKKSGASKNRLLYYLNYNNINTICYKFIL